MATETPLATKPKSDAVVEQRIQRLRELYADAPEIGKAALEKTMPNLKRELAAGTGAQNAGRIGARQGKVSELTGIFPFATPAGAKRLRVLLQYLEGNFKGGDLVGTLTTCASSSSRTIPSCSSRPLTMATGIPISTTS